MAKLSPDDIYTEIVDNFNAGAKRRFLPGLLVSFIGFLRELDAINGKYKSLDEFYAAFPRQNTMRNGGKVNTIVVMANGKRKSIRGHYNKIENWFRAEMKRFDYPSAAPHATQAGPEYQRWLEALLGCSDAELKGLEARVKQFVLDTLPAQGIDPTSIKRDPPRFLLFLQDFDLSKHTGETTGAAYQGTVFGYIRADAPHLQVEVGKVRTGSKREKRVGDIDARDGDALVLSAEVKQYVFGEDALPDVAEFANLVAQHRALGLVVALDFEEGMREELIELGLSPVSRDDLIQRVKLWDPLKQKIAVNALLYYVGFREQNSALFTRIKGFMQSVEGTEFPVIVGEAPAK